MIKQSFSVSAMVGTLKALKGHFFFVASNLNKKNHVKLINEIYFLLINPDEYN